MLRTFNPSIIQYIPEIVWTKLCTVPKVTKLNIFVNDRHNVFYNLKKDSYCPNKWDFNVQN